MAKDKTNLVNWAFAVHGNFSFSKQFASWLFIHTFHSELLAWPLTLLPDKQKWDVTFTPKSNDSHFMLKWLSAWRERERKYNRMTDLWCGQRERKSEREIKKERERMKAEKRICRCEREKRNNFLLTFGADAKASSTHFLPAMKTFEQIIIRERFSQGTAKPSAFILFIQ